MPLHCQESDLFRHWITCTQVLGSADPDSFSSAALSSQLFQSSYLCVRSVCPESSILHLSILNLISLIKDCFISISKPLRILTPFSEALQLGFFKFYECLPYSVIQVIDAAANRCTLANHVNSAFLA